MKKIFFLLACFLFVGVVSARTLTVEEVIEGFMSTDTLKLLNDGGNNNIRAIANPANGTIEIYSGDTLTRSYPYTTEGIVFTDNREINDTTTEEQNVDFFFLTAFMESVIAKSGYDTSRLNNIPDNFVWNYDTYGISITEENNFIREWKIGFDTTKIDAFVAVIGLKEDLSDKVAVITITDKTNKSVSLNAYVEGSTESDGYTCYLLRSTKKDKGFERLTNFEINCSSKDVSYVDDTIKKGVTYYYKAMVVGSNKYSNVISYNTDGKVANPKTGVNQFIPLMIGFIVSVTFLFLFRRNRNMGL